MSVYISLGEDGDFEEFDIEDVMDVKGELWKACFGLEKAPTLLKLKGTKKNVYLNKIQEGESYIIPVKQRPSPQRAEEAALDPTDPDLLNGVLVAHCASIAHSADEAELGKVLKGSRGITKVVRSTHSSDMSIIIADAEDEKKVYVGIASSLSKGVGEIKLLEASQLGVSGKIHPLVRDVSKLFPLQTLRPHLADKTVVFTGYGLGGCLAALWAILGGVPAPDGGLKHKCFTFGLPLFHDGILRSFCEENMKSQISHIVSHDWTWQVLGESSSIPVGTSYTIDKEGHFERIQEVNDPERAVRSINAPNRIMDLILGAIQRRMITRNENTEVQFTRSFVPEISSARLVSYSIDKSSETTTSDQNTAEVALKLIIEGSSLECCILSQCRFSFGFPFSAEEKTLESNTAKQLIIVNHINRNDLQPISAHGVNITVATPFGPSDSFHVDKGKFQWSQVENSLDDAPSVVIKKALQRGLALKEVSKKSDAKNSEIGGSLLKLVEGVAKVSLGPEGVQKLKDIVSEVEKSGVGKTFSTIDGYKKVKDFLEDINKSLNDPVKISKENSWYKIGLTTLTAGGVLLVVGLTGGAAAFAGIAVASLTAFEVGVASSVMIGLGAAALGGGIPLTKSQQKEVENYRNFLQMAIAQLESLRDSKKDADFLAHITALKDKNNLTSLETALQSLWEKSSQSFGNIFNKETAALKELLRQRVECAIKILELRALLSKQCFVGVIGNQDAGKTTMLNRLFGLKGKTGQFTHTDTAEFHKLGTSEVYIVDYPGSSSLEEHAETFSMCGMMNNFVIVLVPYTGDISNIVSKSLHKVFLAMQGNTSTQVVLCVNKCGYGLPEAIKNELKKESQDPIGYLKHRYATELTKHFKKEGSNFLMPEDNILFTDWMLPNDHEGRRLGILGVAAVQEKMAAYLKMNNVEDIPSLFQLSHTLMMAGNCALGAYSASLDFDTYEGFMSSQTGMHSYSRTALGRINFSTDSSIGIFIGETTGELKDHVIITFHGHEISRNQLAASIEPGPLYLPKGEYSMELISYAQNLVRLLYPFLKNKFGDRRWILCGYGSAGGLAALATLELHKTMLPKEHKLPQCVTFDTPPFCTDLDSTEYDSSQFTHLFQARSEEDSKTQKSASAGRELCIIGAHSYLLRGCSLEKLDCTKAEEIAGISEWDDSSAQEWYKAIKSIRFAYGRFAPLTPGASLSKFCQPKVTQAELERTSSPNETPLVQLLVHGENLACYQFGLCRADWNYPFFDDSVTHEYDPRSQTLVFSRKTLCLPALREKADTLTLVTPFGEASFDEVCILPSVSSDQHDQLLDHQKRVASHLVQGLFRASSQIDGSLLQTVKSHHAIQDVIAKHSEQDYNKVLCYEADQLISACTRLAQKYISNELVAPGFEKPENSTPSTAKTVIDFGVKLLGYVDPRAAAIAGFLAEEAPRLLEKIERSQKVTYNDYLKLLALKCQLKYQDKSSSSGNSLEQWELYLAGLYKRHNGVLLADIGILEDSRKEVEEMLEFISTAVELREGVKNKCVLSIVGSDLDLLVKTTQEILELEDQSRPKEGDNGLSWMPYEKSEDVKVAICSKPAASLTPVAIMSNVILLVLPFRGDSGMPFLPGDIEALSTLKNVQNIHNNLFVHVTGIPEGTLTNQAELKARCAAQINGSLEGAWIVLTDRVSLGNVESTREVHYSDLYKNEAALKHFHPNLF